MLEDYKILTYGLVVDMDLVTPTEYRTIFYR